MPYDEHGFVLVNDRNGNAVLVPKEVSEADRKYIESERSRVRPPEDSAIDVLIGEPEVHKMSREEMVTRMRQAGQNVSDVADRGYDQRMAEQERMRQRIGQAGEAIRGITESVPEQPTPFTDVRRGIGEQLVTQHPSQSDILSEADLRLADEMRRRKLGI